MKAADALCAHAVLASQPRLADYLMIAKPRLTLMALLTVAAGGLLATETVPDWVVLGHTLLGAALVAVGASALNQVLEKNSDALMRRTENRPLPAERLQTAEVLIPGTALAVLGVGYLAVALREPLAALVAALIFISYVLIYTPLKRVTTLNTLVGAVPGALPPVLGWAAMRGTIGIEAGALFLILFLWQVPHFLAIAWIHREDYARAGLRMLPVLDRDGGATSRQMVSFCLALCAASLTPFQQGRAGVVYLLGALVLGAFFLGFTVAFLRCRSLSRARGVLRASLLYLPLLLALLLASSASR